MRKLDWQRWSFVPALLLIAATVILGFTVKWQVFDSPGGPVNETATRNLKIMSFVPLIVLQLLFFAMMVALDEGLRQMRSCKWQFAGALTAFNCALIFCTLKQQYGPPSINGINPFWWGMLFALTMAAIAYALEWLRQPLPPAEPEADPELPDFSNRNFCCYEHCNPMWINILLIFASCITFIPMAMGQFPAIPIVLGGFVILFVGGFHVAVNCDRFTLYFGILKIKLLNLKLAEIKEAEVTDFNPVRDFGGWGIRYGSKCGWGFILGSRGVKIVTARGRRITVSMRHPELAVAIWERQASANQNC